MANSLLSGSIGIPDGAYRLMNDPVQRAVEQIVKNELEIRTIIQEGGTGGGSGFAPIAWARVKANGTIIVDEGFTSATRTEIGVYSLDTDTAVGTSGSNALSAVLVTPSSASGDGGDGSSPFKAFDTYEVVSTDATANPVWTFNTVNGKIYLLGPAVDDVFIHTDTTFTTAAVQVDADGSAIEGSPATLAGGLSHEGGYVWVSGNSTPVRVMRVSDNVFFNFGGTPVLYFVCATDNLNALAGSGVSGPRVWLSDGGDIKAYDPDITGESLGSVQLTYTGVDPGTNNRPALIDKDGYIWCLQGGNLKQLSPIAATVVTHAYPTETPSGEAMAGSLGGASRLTYDAIRNVIYAVLTSTDPNSYIWTYSGWQPGLANSGRWEFITKVTGFASVSYESAQDLLFIANYSNGQVLRYAGYPKTLIDVVSVDNTTPDNTQIDYDLESAYVCFYKSDSTGDYAYVSGAKAGQFLIKISYNGADISLGDGGSVVSAVLIAHGTITDTNTVKVELFRSLSPPIRADGQFNVAVFGKT